MEDSDRRKGRRRPIWHWIAIVLVLPFLAFVGVFVGPVPLIKRFHIPSESMQPTLLKNDSFLARMGVPGVAWIHLWGPSHKFREPVH